MQALGREGDQDTRVYFTGGATAVLFGWRDSTIDVDIAMVPERDRLLRALPSIKESLSINIELASPPDFVPIPAGWEERSPFIRQEGRLFFHHFDLYGQALAKVARGHAQDVDDVRAMLERRLIEPAKAVEYFDTAAPALYRYPSIDPPALRAAVVRAFGGS
jgi:hypothetical protein